MERSLKRIMLASAGIVLLASCSSLLMQGYVSQVQASAKKTCGDNNYNFVSVSEHKASQFGDYATTSSVKGDVEATGNEQISQVNTSGFVEHKSIFDIITEVRKVEISSVKNVKTKSALLKWKKLSGISGYEIYRARQANGTYKKIRTITKPSTLTFKDTNLSKKTTYYYKIRAYKKVDGVKVNGEYSEYKSVYIKK